VSGYGYTGQGNVGQADGAYRSETGQPSQGAGDDQSHHAEVGEEVARDTCSEVPGYEASASSCFNRARQIARSLNHLNLTADHLMLALTMDPGARRLLERVSDVTQLREAAMQRLGHYGSARSSSEQSSTPTSDLADIAKAARDAANEREQSVSISDLINAFPKSNGRLTYGSGDGDKAIALDGADRGGPRSSRRQLHDPDPGGGC
jgi:Clp amino terminal domain, pathogenicity island component